MLTINFKIILHELIHTTIFLNCPTVYTKSLWNNSPVKISNNLKPSRSNSPGELTNLFTNPSIQSKNPERRSRMKVKMNTELEKQLAYQSKRSSPASNNLQF